MILDVFWTFCRINFLAFDKEDSANDDAFSNAMGLVSSSIVEFGNVSVRNLISIAKTTPTSCGPKAEDGKEEQEKNGADEGK